MTAHTACSSYLFDRTTMTALRVVRTGLEMRRDKEPIPLLEWPRPVVGEEMYLLLQLREDDIQTVRRTSFVTAIGDKE